MKLVRRLWCSTLLFVLMMAKMVYASELTWSDFAGNHKESVLLPENVKEAEDSTEEIERGIRLSAGVLRIANGEDGTLHITVETFAHTEVDIIYQTVFLDEWDEDREDWKQIGKWDFEKTKEESEDEIFEEYHVGFTVTGCQPNRYYRARAMHLVEWGDEAEAKVTQTNGVLLTDHEV